jgi:hypothetical protein
MTRSYSMVLPMGTTVEIYLPGAVLVPAVNLLLKDNQGVGWTYEDCLTMRALRSINGQLVEDLNAALTLDVRDYICLKAVVTSLAVPSPEEMNKVRDSIKLLDSHADVPGS